MLTLSTADILMHQHADNKTQALQLLANALQKDQLTTADYLHGMTTRETQTSTYLGQGIAIPHGTPESRQAVLQTGIRIAHFPQGVAWDDEHTVYLAVAIAAQSDEHLSILQLLTRALSENIENKLKNAQTAHDILAILQAEPTTLLLHENLIAENVAAQDSDEAIWQAIQLLKQNQCVGIGFFAQLQPSTAVQIQDKIWCITGEHAVFQAAASIVKLARAVKFNDGELDTLVCVAANAHLDWAQMSRLLDALFRQPLPPHRRDIALAIGAEVLPDWAFAETVLLNAHGLHARPATALAKLCQSYQGEIKVSANGGRAVSAKSLSQLLSLGAVRGQTLRFVAEPSSEDKNILKSIISAVENGLGETVELFRQPENENHSENDFAPVLKTLNDDERNQAVAASAGLAWGQIHLVKAQQFEYERISQNIAAEQNKLATAINQVKHDLNQLVEQADSAAIKNIFTAHIALLEDPELLQQVERGLQQNLTAAAAWHSHIEQLAKEQESLNNQLLAERAADLRDVGNKVLAQLCGVQAACEPDSPYILLMADLIPSVVAQLDKNRVAGILTARGGASSHSAIVARALGIPAVMGAGDEILHLSADKTILLDGEEGVFYVNPSAQRLELAEKQQANLRQQRELAEQNCQSPAITLDGHQVEIAVNLGNVADAAKAVQRGAEAVGLLRTELVFMAHQSAPDETKQILDYQQVFDAMGERPVVVRTLDVGGDKPLPYLPMPKEDNPFLGERGIRLTLRRPQLLRQQLRALFQAAGSRPLRVMFPMIGRVEEWHAAKAILDDVLKEKNYPDLNLQVGIMVEVPSAALMAERLAQEVDFFSIGTNDLTQYVMAIDRGHPILSAEADGLHPSVLKLIEHTVQAAHAHGKWVGVCGELAAERPAVPILLGLGVDELSISANRIPMVKAQIRGLKQENCREIAQAALKCANAAEVRALHSEI